MRGIIPAHAGRASATSPRGSTATDHPRSRGAGSTRKALAPLASGSSPLTRGGRRGPRCEPLRAGIIPAHAGRARRGRRWRRRRRDHPRSRGAGLVMSRVAAWLRGSSPLTRGGRVDAVEFRVVLGIIPAHAGRAEPASSPQPRPWDHPRSRGAGHVWITTSKDAEGSSPLTRGGPLVREVAGVRSGIIPAHAGRAAAG